MRNKKSENQNYLVINSQIFRFSYSQILKSYFLLYLFKLFFFKL